MKTFRFVFVWTLLAVLCDGSFVFAQDTNQDKGPAGLSAKTQFTPLKIRIVFFTPSDLKVPAGAHERITQVANYMETFFFNGMKHWNYPPAVTNLFQRDPDGMVQMLKVRGDEPVASGKYNNPDYARYVIEKASKQYGIDGTGDIWWIFVYLGDPPARFATFKGGGKPRDGGWAMVNYDSQPGKIRPDFSMVEGFNGRYYLKGSIHELGHAFGLPHIGPNPDLGLGNTLMGPATVAYVKREGPNPYKVYLDDASAAMLWKHPFFSGTDKERLTKPNPILENYKASFNATNRTVTLSGKLVADLPAHSVVVMDDQGRPGDEYWFRTYVARIAPDGTFRVAIDKPIQTDGKYSILFCFDNGAVTGDGRILFGAASALQRTYRFHDGKFEFEN